MSWLLTEWGSPVVVRRADACDWEDAPHGRRRTLDQTFGSGRVNIAVLELLPGWGQTLLPLSHGALHHAYVVSGEVLAGTIEEPQTLSSGDFIRFQGDASHVLCATKEPALVHLVTTIPQAAVKVRVAHTAPGHGGCTWGTSRSLLCR